MATLRERRNPARLFMRRLAIFGLCIGVIAGASGVWSTYQKEQASALLKEEAQTQLKSLSQEQDQLTASIGQLETKRGKEEALREQYGMAQPGENEIVIVDPASSSAPTAPTSTSFAQWIKSAFPWW